MKPKVCKECDIIFTPDNRNKTVCEDCKSKPEDNKCCDCNKIIGKAAKRCWPCSNLAKSNEGNHNWKGRGLTTQGYVILNNQETKAHPNAHATGRILEHVYVMSNHINRPLVNGEEVHHKNGNRSDNRIENLELWTRSHPTGVRVTDLYEWCQDYINQYRADYDNLV